MGCVTLFLVGLPAAQDLLVILVLVVGLNAQPAVGFGVVLESPRERPRAGQEPLLHEHRHDAARLAAAVAPRALGKDRVQQRELLGLVLRGGEGQDLEFPGQEALHVLEVRLETADRDVAQRALVQVGAPLEPAAVDHLHQRGERLGVAVVRGGGQEQPVLAFLRERPGGDRPLAVDRVAAEPGGRGRASGRDVVGLVDDEHVERVPAGGARILNVGVHGAQQTLGAHRRQPRHRHDHPRVEAERVGVRPVGAQHLRHQLGVDNLEFEAELLPHLVPPLQRQARRAHDDGGAGPVPQQQLLNDQARLDRLAEADVVGEQKVRPRGLQGAAQRLELVGLDVRAAAERGLEGPVPSAEVTAPHRTASTKAARVFGLSKPSALIVSGRPWSGAMVWPTSSSQTTARSCPRRSSSSDCSRTMCVRPASSSSAGLRGRPCCRTSATAQVAPRTLTICPCSGRGGTYAEGVAAIRSEECSSIVVNRILPLAVQPV